MLLRGPSLITSLYEFLFVTINSLRSEHPGARVIFEADIDNMKLGLLHSLDPTLKQTLRGFTNKNQDKSVDVFLMDCPDLYQEPSILPQMTVDVGKQGKDSDHNGVEALPQSNLAPTGSSFREKITVHPFPEFGLAQFECKLRDKDWSKLLMERSPTDMVAKFEAQSKVMVDAQFPYKTVLLSPQDLPYFTEDLRKLKQKRQCAYRKGKKKYRILNQ